MIGSDCRNIDFTECRETWVSISIRWQVNSSASLKPPLTPIHRITSSRLQSHGVKRVYVVGSQWASTSFRADASPVLCIKPGDTCRFEVSPEPIIALFAAGDRWLDALDLKAINVITGPVSIGGVAPGDTVSVEILEIETLAWGWSAIVPNVGLLGNTGIAPSLRSMPIRNSQIEISDRFTLAVRPMIGCLGLAPATGETSTLSSPRPWGGNFDLVQIKPGNTVLLPAQQAGGLFSLGDLHAAMGQGEATDIAVECAGAATVRLGVRKGLHLATPRIETPKRLYTMGMGSVGDYATARRQAVRLMFDYFVLERRIPPADAHTLMSASVDLSFGGPASAIVLAGVPWSVLE